jgi:hypothetical protein
MYLSGIEKVFKKYIKSYKEGVQPTLQGPPDPHNVDLATIRLPYAGPTTGLKSVFDRLYERRPLADFRLVVGPTYGSRMVAKSTLFRSGK